MKKCLFIYGNHNIENLFDKHPSKINFHGQWIALKDLLLQHGIKIFSKNDLKSINPDLEIHLNASKVNNNSWHKFAILNETKFIHPDNGDIKLLKKYDHVFSWDTNLIKLDFVTKIQLAHPLGKGIVDGYKNRNQFIVLFGSNRNIRGWHPAYNLYNERVKTIKWFERNAPNKFALYGKKWNLSARLATRVGAVINSIEKKIPFKNPQFPSWKGVVLNKQEILLKSRFSIVYENIRGLNGYITEKIFDAFVAGNVPIYWGASNVSEYIPNDCFIDRREFDNHEQLYKFLLNMKENEFLKYQLAIKNFLELRSNKFSCQKFANTIVSKIIKTIDN